MPKKKYYAVAVGRQTGIFDTWNDCEKQVKGYSGAIFKSFKIRDDAQAFIDNNNNSRKRSFEEATTRDRTATSTARTPTTSTTTTRTFSTTTSAAATQQALVAAQQQQQQQLQQMLKRPRSCLPLCLYIQIQVMFDGGSRGNPGVAGAGAIVTTQQTPVMATTTTTTTTTNTATTKHWQNRRVTELRHYLGPRNTNNEAEYQGLCMGLEQALEDAKRIVLMEQQQQQQGLHEDLEKEEQQQATDEADDDDEKQQAKEEQQAKDPQQQQQQQQPAANIGTRRRQDPKEFVIQCLIQGDSQLVIRQMRGEYQVKKEGLKPYHQRAQDFVQEFVNLQAPPPLSNDSNKSVVTAEIKLEHVLREFNSKADALGNEAMDARRSWKTVTVDGEPVVDGDRFDLI